MSAAFLAPLGQLAFGQRAHIGIQLRVMSIPPITTGAHPTCPKAARLSVTLCTLMLLSACSNDPNDVIDDLDVAKMPKEQVQAASFLPLNADKPGENLHVTRYLAKGKYNIVMYYSPYDGLSPSFEAKLKQLLQVRQDIAVRTININRPEIQGVDWESQLALDLQLKNLPYFVIYDPRLIMRAKGRTAFEQVNQFVQVLHN